MRAPRAARRRCAHITDHLARDTPMLAFVAEVVCTLGATPPRTASSSPPNGGNCTIRGATRRRHAEARLLMLQNPHPCPWRHALTPAPRSHPGATLPPRRHAPLVVRRCSTRPCWALGMELMAGVAMSLGGPRWRRGGLASSATALVADEALRPIGKSRPL